MNVFLVDSGKLFSLDAGMVSRRVQDLQIALSDLADIPIDKQVLLTFDGRSLDATQHLYSYVSPVSADKPIFLFSKSNIECHMVQPAYAALPHDKNLQGRLERYMQDGQACETLKLGADLARDYHIYAEEILVRTRQLVEDQELQRKGWAAVISNLDQVTLGFEKRVELFHELYDSFLKYRDKYSGMLVQFDEDVKILSQIPLTTGIMEHMKQTKMIDSIRCSKEHGLGITESMREPDPGESPSSGGGGTTPGSPLRSLDSNKGESFSLLHWIEAQDSQNSLNSLVLQCTRALDQINTSFLPRVQEEIDKVKQSLQAPGMRDIRGLEERLHQLQSLLIQTERICEEQAANAKTIGSQEESFMVQGDVSVLADLLIAHREQLKRLHSNNRMINEYANKFAAAKGELSQNLLIRLNWVTHCQKAIWSCDGRLTMVSENLVRVKRRFAILEQINVSPTLYFKCLGEVARRTKFSQAYKSRGQQIIERVEHERSEECQHRTEFHELLQGHFLTTLFRGLDSTPSQFADKDCLSFDDELFDVSEEEMGELTCTFPSYAHLLQNNSSQEASLQPQVETDGPSTGAPPHDSSAEDLAVQLDRVMKLEMELSASREQNSKLVALNEELESGLTSTQEALELKVKELAEVEPRIEELRSKHEYSKQECLTFQNLACEKDKRIKELKAENDQLKVQRQGYMLEKPKLEDLQNQLKSQTNLVSEKEDVIKNLKRDLDLIRSGETVNERHRQQLVNLQREIEERSEKERVREISELRAELDKDKMLELEELRLEKDKAIAEMERRAKIRDGEFESTVEKMQDEISKLMANVAVLEAKNSQLQKENDDNLETYAMFKAESERDIKLQKQNSAVVLEELKSQASRREASYQERISLLQEQIASRAGLNTENGAGPSNVSVSGHASVSGNASASDVATSDRPVEVAQLTAKIEQQQAEIETLRASKARCVDVAVTQFQKGDTVFFYFDEAKSNYLIANVNPGEYQYFLHPDNLGALDLSLDPNNRKPWAIGVIKDKEFCQARKVNNRFKVAEGCKFYRVYAQQRVSDSAVRGSASGHS